jgi:hypothetical protein
MRRRHGRLRSGIHIARWAVDFGGARPPQLVVRTSGNSALALPFFCLWWGRYRLEFRQKLFRIDAGRFT